MASSEFERALEFTLRWEGGYSDHPNDPGGATNQGVTQGVYDAFRKAKGLPTRPVRELSTEECREIYYRHYWLPVEARTSPQWVQLRFALFDSFVNFGVHGGTTIWQFVCGTRADGIWGPLTSEATQRFVNGRGVLWCSLALVGSRIRYRARRVSENRSQLTFLWGWLNRDTDLMLHLLDLR